MLFRNLIIINALLDIKTSNNLEKSISIIFSLYAQVFMKATGFDCCTRDV